MAAISTSTVLEECPSHLKDIATYRTSDIICSLQNLSVIRGSKWSITEYPIAFQTFNTVKGLEREKEYNRVFAH